MVLRWILLVPLAVVAWYAVFIFGLFSYWHVERDLCPPEDLVSGMCMNEGIRTALAILMHTFVALSAVAVEACTAFVAPSRKAQVVLATLVVGSLVAIYMGAATKEWTLLLSAMVGGIFGAITILAMLRAPASATSLESTAP